MTNEKFARKKDFRVKSTCTAWTNTQRSRVYISEHSFKILSRLRVAFEIGKGVTDIMRPTITKLAITV